MAPNGTPHSPVQRGADPEAVCRGDEIVQRLVAWNLQHPCLSIVAVALLAVIINCYPILFCGRSFVSPTYRSPVVYSQWPSMPGMPAETQNRNRHGSDTAAIMYWDVPCGFIESRSLLEHGELPLWNRYSHAGDTFIGQAITMLGDPLQLIVIVGRGSALAWDIKFLAAKFLFCAGFGLLVLRLLGNGPLSLVFTALAAYCGTFFCINNHPVFFVFCYAPWILLSAMAWLDPTVRCPIGWLAAWLTATVGCFSGGDVEAAVIIIAGLNVTALASTLAAHRAGTLKVIGRMALGTLLFLGLTAPVWLSFLGALEGSYSAHEEIRVTQLPAKCFPEIFDNIFSALTLKTEPFQASAPETGLLVLAGCILSVLKWKHIRNQPFFWVNSIAIVLWSGCIFGWIPASILMAVPLVNRIGHLDADLAFLLVILLMVQSAYGFRYLARDNHFRRTAIFFLGCLIVFEGWVMLGYQRTPDALPWTYLVITGGAAIGAPLLFVLLRIRWQQLPLAGVIGIIILGVVSHYRFGLYVAGNDDHLIVPGPRVTLNGASPGIEQIKAAATDPFRSMGFKWNLTGDYAAVYELEDIRSCAPLSNPALVDLVRNFPGIKFSQYWVIEVLDPIQAQPLLDLFNLRYLLGSPQVQCDAPGFRVVARLDFGIVENLDAWPRAFFSDRIASIPSNDAFIQYLSQNAKHPFISLEPGEIHDHPALAPLVNDVPSTAIPATHYRLLPNSTSFDIHAPSAGMVCLGEGQAKNFTATANGERKEVLTVNRVFKGVYLDKPGDYHLQFIYRPRFWGLSCALFMVALGMTVVLAVAEWRQKRSGFVDGDETGTKL